MHLEFIHLDFLWDLKFCMGRRIASSALRRKRGILPLIEAAELTQDHSVLVSLTQPSDQETRLSREDILPLMVDASTKLAATDVVYSENGDDSDYDDTLWDWMPADEEDDDN
ncbi:hypothetical protein L1987_46105 [Smallanthus sonchifolius]|uniref:Uncharacterized protein n=1 Tax=Smallanthus sonchifolius TaxID=185202 RepID=A0ACB9FYW4_9ASTR|nr:hypothetical protein L1987_46105 [Smallanthus sonchifolius]